jgi:hypothetical protein
LVLVGLHKQTLLLGVLLVVLHIFMAHQLYMQTVAVLVEHKIKL